MSSVPAPIIPPFSIVAANATCTAVRAQPSNVAALVTDRTDRDILEALLDPAAEGLPSNQETIQDEELGPEGPVIAEGLLQQLTELSLEGVKAAEEHKHEAAIGYFTKAILLCAHYAPAYNNRAQVYLIQHKPDLALEDLNMAISYAHRDRSTLKQAYTQRGIIYKKNDQLDRAKRDFDIASRLGSSLAKQELVAMNPYAKMCNAIMAQHIQQLTNPTQTNADTNTAVIKDPTVIAASSCSSINNTSDSNGHA